MSPYISFNDVSDHWAKIAIERAVEKQIIKGYSDQTFRPNDPITRGQFTVILYRGLALTSNEKSQFTDSIPAWAEDAVHAAAEAGYVVGYNDGTFRHEQEITRAELAVILARILKLESTNKNEASFNDSESIPAWASSAIHDIVEQGLMGGYPDGSFRPNSLVTRAEATAVFMRLLAYLNNLE